MDQELAVLEHSISEAVDSMDFRQVNKALEQTALICQVIRIYAGKDNETYEAFKALNKRACKLVTDHLNQNQFELRKLVH